MIISLLQDKNKREICLTPESISVLVQNHHTVLIEGDSNSPYLNSYLNVGAYLINIKEELLDRGDLVIKKMQTEASEIDYLNGESKIAFSKLDSLNRGLIAKILKHKISFIDYKQLPNFKEKMPNLKFKVEFSNFILPYLLRLANFGLKALVEDEELRAALSVMHGKVYNSKLALQSHLPCYEF